jgi:hypothetical protein
MRNPRFNLAELMLAIAFIGLFVAIARRTWGSTLFVHGMMTRTLVLVPTFFALVFIMRELGRPRNDRSNPP